MTKDPVQAWLNAAGRFPLLPDSQITWLCSKRDRLEPGSKAYIKVVNKITQHNLKLIPQVIKRYISKRSGYNMKSECISDLLQQGYIGLRRAAEKFEPKRGYKFSTYAYSWMYQAITRWHNSHDRCVYIPENCMNEVLYRKRHGKPSGTKGGNIKDYMYHAALRAMNIETIDRTVGDSEDMTPLLDMMTEENRLTSRKSAEKDWATLRLRDLMAKCQIEPRTQDIVLLRSKLGRISATARQLKIKESKCSALFKEAVETMRNYVEQQEQARAALVAGRLSR